MKDNIKKLTGIRRCGIELLNSGNSNNVDLVDNPIIEKSAQMFRDLKKKYEKPKNPCIVCKESNYGMHIMPKKGTCKRCYSLMRKKRYQIDSLISPSIFTAQKRTLSR